MKNRLTLLLSILSVFGAILIADSTAVAQGRSGNAGRPANAGPPPNVGRPPNAGPPANIGRPANPGVGTGLGTASERSGGRSEGGLTTANERSNGRSATGLDRARQGRENQRRAEQDLSENPGAAALLNSPISDLREQYRQSLDANPRLKFGQFVAAQMLERNLNARFSNVTSTAILADLAEGNSIGSALRALGVNSTDARSAEREAARAIKESKRRN